MVICFTAISEIQPQALSTTPSTSSSSQLRNRAFPHHWASDIYYISPLSVSESGNDKTFCLSATLSTGSSALSETSHEAIATRYARASHSRRNTRTLLRRPCSRTSYTTESRNSYTSSAESTPDESTDESVRQNIESRDDESDLDSSAESRRIRLDSVGGDEIPFDPTKPKLDWNGRPFESVGAIPPFNYNDELNLQESNFNPFNDRFKIPHRKRTNESYTSLRHPSFDKRSVRIHRKYSAGIQRKQSGGIQRQHSYGGMQRKQSFGGGIQRKPPHSPIRNGSRRSSWQQPASIHLVVASAEPSSMGGHTDRSESISEAETTVLINMHSLGRDTSGWDRGYNSSEDRRFSAWGTSSEGPRHGIVSEEERRHSAWTTSERVSSHGWPNNEHYMHSSNSNSNVLSRPDSPKRKAKFSDNEEVETCRACVML